jgi:glycerophosphoryl diester phosphodiesterase
MTALPLIVAHRGASYDAPENTLAAFRLAFEQGADAIEGDFHATADGHLVCVHDATTGRCGDRDLRVNDTTLAELRGVDVGGWKDGRFAGERMPTLAEVLAIVPAGRAAFLEIKDAPAVVPALAEAVRRSAVSLTRLRVISVDAAVIRQVRDALPGVATSWLVEYTRDDAHGPWTPDAETVLGRLADSGADGLGTEALPQVVTPAFVRSLRDAKAGLHVWTVDTPDAAETFARLGVDSITTNRPALIRQHLCAAERRISADKFQTGR